ncbi:MAG TPA: serine protein kinase RIO [Thermoplasmatales archaeon]|nr:MAG: serine protein kinase RIO [Thermoplasmata archaeon]HDM25497.1 serine protein kinase RIO [Thermoplasmatales archaeon]
MRESEKFFRKIDAEIERIKNRIGADRKILEGIFDKPTLLVFGKLFSDKIIDIVEFPISVGKEGCVFRALTPDKKFVAVKVYRVVSQTFKNISKYIEGDPRFRTFRNRRDLIYEWANKEFKNLQILENIGITVPHPIRRIKNVLVMEYIGDETAPAPLLKDIKLSKPKKFLDKLIKYMEIMYQKAELVHGDLSEYNILVHNEKPYIIDVGQTVLKEHPMALEFLRRDIHNLIRFFKNKYNLKEYEEETLYSKIIKK